MAKKGKQAGQLGGPPMPSNTNSSRQTDTSQKTTTSSSGKTCLTSNNDTSSTATGVGLNIAHSSHFSHSVAERVVEEVVVDEQLC